VPSRTCRKVSPKLGHIVGVGLRDNLLLVSLGGIAAGTASIRLAGLVRGELALAYGRLPRSALLFECLRDLSR
jgi:hypothetical protein